MKINDLYSVTNQDFKPFYKVPIGCTFQIYTMRQWNKYGLEEYSSNFLVKQDLVGGYYCGSELYQDSSFCSITPTELVKQITNETVRLQITNKFDEDSRTCTS
jgi:hypothetical protein